MRIGVLALQGGFSEHMEALRRLETPAFELRKQADLEGGLDGLILPGGESTVMGRLLKETGLFRPLQERIARGMPVFGTCAGMILLAGRLENDPAEYFRSIDITVRRNAYGRQLGSFRTQGEFAGIGLLPMTFIRAPFIAACGPGARILARVDGAGVAAEEGNVLVTAFHPELTEDLRVHAYFLSRVRGAAIFS
ncbi:Pyridoxal 5'-phosphate synthase subunit PdxT [bioreactor metagenome]|uniref:glutaminase n=1 Tax=bioreactor metagenome TaxID=1076179 RepID=A0A645GDM7_9ZZZZ